MTNEQFMIANLKLYPQINRKSGVTGSIQKRKSKKTRKWKGRGKKNLEQRRAAEECLKNYDGHLFRLRNQRKQHKVERT